LYILEAKPELNETIENEDGQKDEKPKRLPIPRHLMRLGSSFFKRATKREVFLKNMEKRNKRIKKQQDRANIDKAKKEFVKITRPDPNNAAANIIKMKGADNSLGENSEKLDPRPVKDILHGFSELSSPRSSSLTSSQYEEDAALCNICFANEPNAVIMPCGHGGICNTCSVDLFERDKTCPLCRNVLQ